MPLTLCSIVALTSACGSGVTLQGRTTSRYFNAQAIWVYEISGQKDEETWANLTTMLQSVEKSVSVSSGGAIARFNEAEAGEEVELDKTAYDVLTVAKNVYEKTDGAYNPAVGILIDLWGFSPRFSEDYEPYYVYDRLNPAEQLPEEIYIEEFLKLTDFSEVELSERNGKYYAMKPDSKVVLDGVTYTMQLNLGGIGKGYAADRAEEIIRAAGYSYGYFNLAGSSMSVLKNPNGADGKIWDIGVVSPRGKIADGDMLTVFVSDLPLSSSGDYVQYYELDGKRYSLIIDPLTGYPVNTAPTDTDGSGIICASVFGLPAAEGDATTTALIAMGKDRAIEYIRNELGDVLTLFVWYNASDDSYTLYTNMTSDEYMLIGEMDTVTL